MRTPDPLDAPATAGPTARSLPACDHGFGGDPPLLVANEFAEVCVRRVLTHNGVRLEVSSPRLHRAVRLDALQLEALTWQDSASFSAMLSEPFGPSAGGGAPSAVDPAGDAHGQHWANGHGRQ